MKIFIQVEERVREAVGKNLSRCWNQVDDRHHHLQYHHPHNHQQARQPKERDQWNNFDSNHTQCQPSRAPSQAVNYLCDPQKFVYIEI